MSARTSVSASEELSPLPLLETGRSALLEIFAWEKVSREVAARFLLPMAAYSYKGRAGEEQVSSSSFNLSGAPLRMPACTLNMSADVRSDI